VSVVPRAICQIEFKNVTLRYLPWLDPSLIDLSFRIRGGEKIGVCGRTGSGKSTTSALSLALESFFSFVFRFVSECSTSADFRCSLSAYCYVLSC
jgi:ABC-type multidrug transport system fused ATPase/permease subunit